MTDVKRDPELWRRRFVLEPMRRIIRAVERDLVRVVEAEGYAGVRVAHLQVFAHVPRDEGMRMSVLADRLGVTAGAVSQVVDQLERMALVERCRDRADGRAVRVRPTPAAEAGYEAGRRAIADRERRWADLVGHSRWATFRSVLEEIAAHEQPADNG